MNMYIYHTCNKKCQAGLLVWCLLVIPIMGKWRWQIPEDYCFGSTVYLVSSRPVRPCLKK